MDMGIGTLGNVNTLLKRKFRWTLEIESNCLTGAKIGPYFVKSASRPNYEVEELELNFLNAKTYLAGRLTWQDITVTFIDSNQEETSNLYKWLAIIGTFGNKSESYFQGSSYQDYAGSAILKMYDGCGQAMEEWELKKVWPKSANFGELDYTSNEEATIEVTLKYYRAIHKSLCPQIDYQNCCSPCVE